MRTGADYRQSLRDGRRIWVMGDGLVDDITTHPATRAMVDEYSAWYDRHADPAWTDDFEVTAVWVEDPWFGRTDRKWGTGLAPHTIVSTTDLAADFVGWPSRYFMPTYGAALRYVIVAPLS